LTPSPASIIAGDGTFPAFGGDDALEAAGDAWTVGDAFVAFETALLSCCRGESGIDRYPPGP